MSATPKSKNDHFPPQTKFIVWNEGCERFSFYGMKAILWLYLWPLFVKELGIPGLDAKDKATAVVHFFNAGVYAFPMIGALIADRLMGKYRVIIWLSLVYSAGHGVLAFFGHTLSGMYLGLALIAIGSGGIKPCVSANVGDQFTSENAHLIPRVYMIFYWMINFGSFFSTLLTPKLLEWYGPDVAFGVPGVFMLIATIVFWLGRNKFVKVPAQPGGRLGILDALASIALFGVPGSFFFTAAAPATIKALVAGGCFAVWAILFAARQRIEADAGFLGIVVYSLRHQKDRKPGMGFFDVARDRFGDEAAAGPPAVLKIMGVFAPVCLFWALFDQHASSWVNQAAQMGLELDLGFWKTTLNPGQISALNPIFVMMLIPLLGWGLYGPLEKRGILTPLRKMTAGMFIAGIAFAAAALLQARIEALAPIGGKVHVGWQAVPYLIMSLSEVLVSTTGLEFAYTQAPRAMKSTIMGFWLLTVSMGNLLVAFMADLEKLSLVRFFWLFTGLMGGAALVFAVIAYFYRGRTYLQDDAQPEPSRRSRLPDLGQPQPAARTS